MSGSCATLPAVTDAGAQPDPSMGGRAAFDADGLAAATGGTLIVRGDRPIHGAAVDSRRVTDGAMFVALPGERTDGHDHVAAAVAAGAAALVVTRTPDAAGLAAMADARGGVTVVRVADGIAALQAAAASWRSRFAPIVVGVTGSVGKTSMKEAVAAVLGSRMRTLRSPGNENNEIGVPLTLLRLDEDVEAAVLEMGMYGGGEIAALARIGRPSIGVVTLVAPVHLERIGSMRAIEDAKAELVESLPADGVAVLNADDPVVRTFDRRTRARSVLYGVAPDADVRVADVRSLGADGTAFTLVADGMRRAVATPVLGRHSASNAAGAAAVGIAAGLDLDAIAEALAGGWGAAHRVEIVDAGRFRILDDAYNASPPSMLAALDILAGLPGRPVAVLGEMLELGAESAAGHRDVGAAAGRTVDELVVVGAGAAAIADAATDAGLPADRVHRVEDRDAALAAVRRIVRDGDIVLVKASRGAALDLLVAELRADAVPTAASGDADGRPEPAR
jgi:UDP-N-acetylmuramoyl-tripeptide--D-alanyl-D-alanine ligase